MNEFLRAYRKYDPATTSTLEVALLYPGVKAILFHRIAHALYRAKIPFLPRALSEFSRFITGIDIHPGAKLGRCLVIDHGMGLVIGETAEVGDHVILYHGVTLGGTALERVKRHPTVGNHVVIGAGAKVLGNIRVGDGVRIGANSVVVHDVPAHSTAVGIPARVFPHAGVAPGEELCHEKIEASFLGEGI